MKAKDDSSTSLISNSFYLMLDWGMSTVLSLFFWIIVSRTFTVSDYGIVSTSVNMSLVIAAFGLLGINAVVVRLIPMYMKSGHIEKVKGLVSFCIKFALISNITIAALIAFFSVHISKLLNIPVESVLMVSVLVIGYGMWYLSNGIFQGMQKMRLLFGSNMVGQVLKLVLPILLFSIISGFMGPLIAFVVSLFVPFILRLPFLPIGKGESVSHGGIIFGLGLPLLVSSIMWLIFTNIPNVIVSSVTSDRVATGIFSLALTLVVPIVFIPMTLSQALAPINSGLSATLNPKKRQSKLISLTVKFTAFLTTPLVALLLVFSSHIILFFSHKVENLPASDLLLLLAPSALMVGIGQILSSSLFATGDIKGTRNVTLTSAAVFFTLGILGTYYLSLLGMAIAYMTSAVLLVTVSYLYLRRNIGLSFDFTSLGKIVVASIVFVIVTLPLNAVLQSNIIRVGVIILGLVAYLSSLALMRYYSIDEIKIVRHLSERSRLLSKILSPVERFLLRVSRN
jgi:O-antigen/teichoic acid export membrane protein